jgi:dienelactone hydrolase
MSTSLNTSKKADHLCVLVHGYVCLCPTPYRLLSRQEEELPLTATSLWGKPEHLKYVSTTLGERYPEDKLHVLVAKRNAGSFTYDGIDTGGERVAEEVERKLEELAEAGHDVTKISVVGYSLGGLIARYAIGLLFHRGIFEKIQPVVCLYTTPHDSSAFDTDTTRTSPRLRHHTSAYEHPSKATIATSGTSWEHERFL